MKSGLNLVFCSLMLVGVLGHATPPKHLWIDSATELGQGELISVALSEEGYLVPGPKTSKVHDLEDISVWDVTLNQKNGKFYAGTGPEGGLYELDPSGKKTLFAKFTESDIYAVAEMGDGSLLVGTSPKGKVFRVNSSGAVTTFFEPKEEFIWDILVAKSGKVYVATGSTGKVYQVDGKGRGKVLYDSDEKHIRSLALTEKGELLAGSADKGFVYKIAGEGKTVVLLDSNKEEIRKIVSVMEKVGDAEQEIIYILAVGKDKKPSKKSSSSKTIRRTSSAGSAKGPVTLSAGPSLVKTGKTKVGRGSSSSSSSRTGTSVYRLDGDFYPEEIWSGSLFGHDMLEDLSSEGGVVIGAGNQGEVVKIHPQGAATFWSQVRSERLTALGYTRKKELFAFTSGVATSWRISNTVNSPAVYRSKVIDSKLFANWGSIRANGQGTIRIRSRSGNTSNPDKSWYDWTFLKDGKVSSPAARYVQFEVLIQSGQVDSISFYYQPRNQPPSLETIAVLPQGIGFNLMASRSIPPQPMSVSQLLKIVNLPAGGKHPSSDRFQRNDAPGLRTVIWDAKDSNGDALRYTVEVKGANQREWNQLASDLSVNLFSWDTSGWKDGEYVVRVTATDSLSNQAGAGGTAVITSAPWRIDHTRPEITLRGKNATEVTILVSDEGGVLTRVVASTDGSNYRPAFATDGILDSGSESFVIPREDGKPLYIRVTDASGNTAGLFVEADE